MGYYAVLSLSFANLGTMIYSIFILRYILFQFKQKIKQWAKPATQSLISGVLSDLTRSRSDLIVENALLR